MPKNGAGDDEIRDRDRPRHRDRESSRDRNRDRGRRRHSRSRSPRRHRGSGSRRDSRSRSPDRRRQPRSRSRERSAERAQAREKEQKDRERERQELEISRAARKLEDEANREIAKKQQEIDDLTKDQRTIFVGQLTMKVGEGNLKDFFGQLGRVKNIIMVRDKHTGKHKGFAYVEMADLETIPNCLLFNDAVPDFQKFPILVKPSEAEKNYLAKKESSAKVADPKDGPDCRVYVGNIHVNINEDALRSVLEQFGPVDSVNMHRDEMGNSKGFAFVRYRTADAASLAMVGLMGMELVGRPLKVGPVLDNQTKALLAAANMGGGGGGSSFPSSMGYTATANWKLDDDDGSKGMALNSQSRQMLMARLGEGAGIQVPALPIPQIPQAAAVATVPITGLPTCSFVVANMFDPATETEPGWDLDVREDVMDECGKFGKIEHCYVEKSKPGGLVFLKFVAQESAALAAHSLHGRFFAGRMITITYLEPEQYNALVM